MEGEGKQLQPIYVPAVQLPGQGVGPEAVRCPLISCGVWGCRPFPIWWVCEGPGKVEGEMCA